MIPIQVERNKKVGHISYIIYKSSFKIDQIPKFATDSMDGPEEYYAKWNKPVRERQIPYDFTYLWNLMNKLN